MSSSSVHSSPSGDCIICCEDFNSSNYAEFEISESSGWHRSPYCQQCIVSNFISKQWSTYIDNLSKADCAAALRRLLSSPPPLYVTDAGFKISGLNNSGEVKRFWFSSSNSEQSAKLENAPEGAARESFWNEKKSFLTQQEIAEEQAKKDKKDKDENDAK